MEPTNRKIQSLVDMFMHRELLLPEMQRKYVWRASQIRDLLDSIYRDYPSGSILIWETDNLPELKTHSFNITSQLPIGKKLLLLDGQQRITSLASIVTGAPIRIKEGTKIKEKLVDLYFNVDHPDEAVAFKEIPDFEVGDFVEAKWTDGEFYPGKIASIEDNIFFITYDDGAEEWSDEVRDLSEEYKKQLYFQIVNKKIENKPYWVSVTKLFKEGVGSILKDMKIGYDNSNFEKFNNRLNQLYSRKDNYLYPLQIIRNKHYNEVTEIFIRVNSSGTRLRGSDLAIAQITSAWPGSMKLFEEFVDSSIDNNYYLDENFLVRCIVCIATKQAKFNNLGKVTSDRLKNSWELTKKGVENTINFLKNVAFVDSSALLPSQILLIPLVVYSSTQDISKTPYIERGFLYWFYNAAIWGRYSASMESRLSQDLATLSNKEPYLLLVDNVWQNVGKDRQVTPDDFKGKTINNPLFFMMYVMARKNHARDLETGNTISYNNFGANNQIEYDHIFPKSKLEEYFKNKLDNLERKKYINDIRNIAFMTKKGNIIKTNDDPIIYFPKIFDKYKEGDYFNRQQIPFDLDLLSYDNYPRFMDKRAELLANEVNGYLGNLL